MSPTCSLQVTKWSLLGQTCTPCACVALLWHCDMTIAAIDRFSLGTRPVNSPDCLIHTSGQTSTFLQDILHAFRLSTQPTRGYSLLVAEAESSFGDLARPKAIAQGSQHEAEAPLFQGLKINQKTMGPFWGGCFFFWRIASWPLPKPHQGAALRRPACCAILPSSAFTAPREICSFNISMSSSCLWRQT